MLGRVIATIVLSLLPAWAAVGADLVYLNTPEGSDRLVTAKFRNQFFAVQPYVDSQQNLAFCGPASIAAVLNSLDIRRPAASRLGPYRFFTQDGIFTIDTERIKPYAEVARRGMTLAEVASFVTTLGARAVVHPADRLDLAGLRALVIGAFSDPRSRIIVNYSRKPLGQTGDGHLSPIAAFDDASDSVLLLDVAKFKYPPTWIGLSDLLAAMATTDPDSGISRGLVIVNDPEPNDGPGSR